MGEKFDGYFLAVKRTDKAGGEGMEKRNRFGCGVDNPLGYAPIRELIGKFAGPSVIGMLVNSAYSITDQIFIGHSVGILGNAAIHVTFPVIMLAAVFAQMVGVGTAANFNLCLGAKKEKEARNFVGTGMALMIVFGIVILIGIRMFGTQILKFCGTTETIFPYAQLYLEIMAMGIPFLLFNHGAGALIRADGSPAYGMICHASGTVLNMILDILFILVFGWGVGGAALASLVGEGFSFLLSLKYFSHFKTIKIEWRMFKLRWAYVLRIVKLGICSFINGMVMMFVSIIMNNTLTYYGSLSVYGADIPLAVSAMAGRLNGLLGAFIIGLSQGCQPIFGYNMGAGNYERVRETYDKALTMAFGIGFVAFVIFQTFPRQLIQIFGTGDALYFQFAEQYLRIHMLTVGLSGVQPLSANYFTGTGNVRQGIVLSLSRQGFFLVPLLILLPLILGLDGVLYAGPAADVLACTLSLAMVSKNLKHLTNGFGHRTLYPR